MADVYNCGGCGGTPQRATKQLRIKRLPAILCMQLKVSLLYLRFPLFSYSESNPSTKTYLQRFEHTFSSSEKVEGKVDFPLSINMLPYTTRPQSRKVGRYMYDLSSAVVHKGKLDAGHYYAYCRQGEQVCTLVHQHPIFSLHLEKTTETVDKY